MSPPADERLIVALDVDAREEAEQIVSELGEDVVFYKIGYRLGFNGGLELAGELSRAGKKVFLDFKLLDIDSTVEKGVERIARLGAAMTTVHGYPHAMRAAVRAAAGSSLVVLAVSVLTSLDAADLAAIGYLETPAALVARRAREARDAGMGGLVASPAEAAAVRGIVGAGMAIVTPGIRPAGARAGDQKRVASPGEALAGGATHLVVGRPIVEAADRRAAARAVLAEMACAQRAG